MSSPHVRGSYYIIWTSGKFLLPDYRASPAGQEIQQQAKFYMSGLIEWIIPSFYTYLTIVFDKQKILVFKYLVVNSLLLDI